MQDFGDRTLHTSPIPSRQNYHKHFVSYNKNMILIFLLFFVMIVCIVGVWIWKKRDCDHFQRSNKIPRVIIHTVKNLHPDLNLLMEHNQKTCPNFEFQVFSDVMIDKFLQTMFPPHVYGAYNKINPEYGACRSDFARYCLLYQYGGVYLDIKSEIVQPIEKFIADCEERFQSENIMILAHWPNAPQHVDKLGKNGEIMNWIMISSPHHPVLYQVIERMVEKIESGINGIGKLFVLELTGPIFLTKVIHALDQKDILITDRLGQYFQYISYRCKKISNCRQLYYLLMNDVPYEKSTSLVLNRSSLGSRGSVLREGIQFF
jgi:hypothetical protein